MAPARLATAAGTLLLLLPLAGCGGERTLSADEFVKEMNANGAALELGPVITENPDGADVTEVTLGQAAPPATGEGTKPEASGNATLLVLEDSDAASEEYDRCSQAPSLTCFRAANVVLRVEDLQPTDQALLTAAIESLAAEGD